MAITVLKGLVKMWRNNHNTVVKLGYCALLVGKKNQGVIVVNSTAIP